MNANLLAAAFAATALVSTSACSPRISDVGTPIDPAELSTVIAPEPGAVAADYRAFDTKLRLYGVQPATGTATIADTSTWETRDVRVGDLVGRNLRVSSIGTRSFELTATTGATKIETGHAAAFRVIRHRDDFATAYRGKDRWHADSASMRDLRARHGDGATATPVHVFDLDAAELSTVAPDGAFSRAGFRPGDQLLSLDGSPISANNLSSVTDHLVTAGTVKITLLRTGVLHDWLYEVD
jgi:hypothetical protein